MKISKLFHWLYACIMFLPLLVIPIFAINIINRSPTPISIQYEVDDVKNFYQGVKNGKPNNLNDIEDDNSGNIDLTLENNVLNIGVNNLSESEVYFNISNFNCNQNDKVFLIFSMGSSFNSNFNISVYISEDYDYNIVDFTSYSNTQYEDVIHTDKYSNIIDLEYGADVFNKLNFYITNNLDTQNFLYLQNVQIFNLTSIFGSGNEPTKEVFESYLTQDYYDFGDNDVVIGNTYITYDDTDIGSQYVYSLYHVVDKYFNFNNILPFEGVYNWFLANVFAGVSPVGFTLLYNLMMYWLFVSLIWLMFDVFMYLPLVIHNLIDKARLE